MLAIYYIPLYPPFFHPSFPSLPLFQAVYNVTKSRYPLEEADYHTLAGIQAATYAAEYPKEEITSESLRPLMDKFYPPHLVDTVGAGKKSIGKLFRQKSAELLSVEEKLQEHFESVVAKSATPHTLKILYLQYCWSKPFYG